MRKRLQSFLGVVLLSCMLLGKSVVFANERPTAEEFPEKTIIIGTYAIVLDVINEELLEVALQSAETNMQNEVYFKSDVNSGVWYNITNSDSISDISESTENIVKNQEIDKLYLTHYTNASGVTISLLTDTQVYVSDIDTPQVPGNIVELDELENELKIQQALYDSVKDEPEDETEKEEDKRLEKKAIYSQKINSLQEVLKEIKNKEVDKLTSQIHAVENLERQLVKNKADSEKIEMVVSQKENLKNTRMAYCYQILIDKMNKENVTIDYEDCNDLIQKYAGAITSLESILSELGIVTDKVASNTGDDDDVDETFSENQPSKEVVEEEATGVDKIIEENLELMLELAENGDFEKAEEALEEAYVAETVKNHDDNVSEEVKEKQKEVLEQAIELLCQEALELVQAGDGKDYEEAVKNKESSVVLEAIKEENVSKLSDLLTQLEDNYASLIEKTEKTNEQAKLLQEKIGTYEELLKIVPNCESEEQWKELLEEKLGYGKEQLDEVKLQSIPEYQETKDLIDTTTAQVEILNEKYLEAVEEGNTEDKQKYKAQLEEALEQLMNAEDKLEQLEDDFSEGKLEDELELGEIADIEQLKEKQEDILDDLEELLLKEDNVKEFSNLLEEFIDLGNNSLRDAETLEEGMDVVGSSLLDLERLLQVSTSEKKEVKLLQEAITQIENNEKFLEEYSSFIEETNQKLEEQLEKTTEESEKVTILIDGKDIYEDMLDGIETTLSQGVQDCIKNALEKEIEKLDNQIEEIQEGESVDSLTKEEQKLLEEYLVFIKETNEDMEKKIIKTTDSSKKIEILNDGKDIYEEKIKKIDKTLKQELRDDIKKLLQTEIDNINKQIASLQIQEEQKELLGQLEELIIQKDDSFEKASDLLEDFTQVENACLEQADSLEEAISMMKDSLSNIKEILQNADTSKKGTKVLEETEQQKKEQLEYLEKYLDFVEETTKTLENQLAKTNDVFVQLDVLADGKETYKEELEKIEALSLEQEIKDCITKALQEEINAIEQKEQQLEAKVEERLAEILGDKSELSEANKALANAQEEKYSPEELDAIATLTDNLREEYEEKGAELIYPWLIIFEDYDIKLTLPVIKIKEEIYVPVEELALQLGADLLISKTNDVIVIKDRGVLIEYILNDNVVYVNDKKMTVALPPAKEIENKVYISLQCFVRAYRLEEATYDDYTILSKK